MKSFYSYVYDGIGKLEIAVESGCITDLHFEKSFVLPDGCIREETPLHRKTVGQLTEYFAGERRTFELPIAPKGTDFQMRCWDALLAIPYGETRSYGDIARAAGSPKGFRAAGMANNRNPIAIIIPCHRVIGADGSLVGFGGGLDIKKFLLDLERENGPS